MAFTVSIKEILIAGGPTLAILIFMSIYSVALIWERWRFHRKGASGIQPLLERVRKTLAEGKVNDAVALCKNNASLAAPVLMAALTGHSNREERKRQAQRAAERGCEALERRLTILGTIASTSPYIGLFGTVLGVMRAFHDLASATGAGPGVVAIGISEALICTAAGLFVAIPAIMAYNYFNHRAQRFAEEMAWISDEIIESLSERAQR